MAQHFERNKTGKRKKKSYKNTYKLTNPKKKYSVNKIVKTVHF